MKLTQVSPEVFVADGDIVQLGREDVEMLKERVGQTRHHRIRICAHESPDDPLHEMVIVLGRDTYVRPHKHPGKSESFHIVEGSADIVIFEEDGTVRESIPMGDLASGRRFYYRLSSPHYHTLLLRTPVLVVHETTNGPFKPEETRFAPWAPDEGDREAGHQFLAALAGRVSDSQLTLHH